MCVETASALRFEKKKIQPRPGRRRQAIYNQSKNHYKWRFSQISSKMCDGWGAGGDFNAYSSSARHLGWERPRPPSVLRKKKSNPDPAGAGRLYTIKANTIINGDFLELSPKGATDGVQVAILMHIRARRVIWGGRDRVRLPF